MKKVLTFSLWGDQPKYTIGAIKNVELAKKFYPDFECWIYIHIDSVPKEIIYILSNFNNVKIIFKTGNLHIIKPMMWRFEAIDEPDVEIMMSRDTDTRFTLREKLAVDDWLKTDKIFHIMRDHPFHNFLILGGMFGTRKIPSLSSWKEIMNTFIQNGDYMYDQDFLKLNIYPIIKDNAVIHATFHKFEPTCRNFLTKYSDENYRFVGEYIYENDNRDLMCFQIIKDLTLSLPI
jgi:hypothetical protein